MQKQIICVTTIVDMTQCTFVARFRQTIPWGGGASLVRRAQTLASVDRTQKSDHTMGGGGASWVRRAQTLDARSYIYIYIYVYIPEPTRVQTGPCRVPPPEGGWRFYQFWSIFKYMQFDTKFNFKYMPNDQSKLLNLVFKKQRKRADLAASSTGLEHRPWPQPNLPIRQIGQKCQNRHPPSGGGTARPVRTYVGIWYARTYIYICICICIYVYIYTYTFI